MENIFLCLTFALNGYVLGRICQFMDIYKNKNKYKILLKELFENS